MPIERECVTKEDLRSDRGSLEETGFALSFVL